MADTISKIERSALMAKVRGKGNRSTEGRVEHALRTNAIMGWTKHPKHVPGTPDFYFPTARLALFVDGCFWHGCPSCGRLPKTKKKYWKEKIDRNRRRDNATRRHLRKRGFSVMRVWEHDLRRTAWLKRLVRMLRKSSSRAEATGGSGSRQERGRNHSPLPADRETQD